MPRISRKDLGSQFLHVMVQEEKCKIKYIEIRKFFDISYGIMETLKIKYLTNNGFLGVPSKNRLTYYKMV